MSLISLSSTTGNLHLAESGVPLANADSSVQELLQAQINQLAEFDYIASRGYQSQSYTRSGDDTFLLLDLPNYQVSAFGSCSNSGSEINQFYFLNKSTRIAQFVHGEFTYTGLPFLTSMATGNIQSVSSTVLGANDVATEVGFEANLVYQSNGVYSGEILRFFEASDEISSGLRFSNLYILDANVRLDALASATVFSPDASVTGIYSSYSRATTTDVTTYDYAYLTDFIVPLDSKLSEYLVNDEIDQYFLDGSLGININMSDGADTVYINAPSGNLVDGGDGLDHAVYEGSLSDFFVRTNRDGALDDVSTHDGSDSFLNVERVIFSDGLLALDVGEWENAGSAYRLYKAAFDREPDEVGLGYWIDVLDDGGSLQLAASGFINSAEFKSLYGANPSDTLFITKLYNNVLDRDPDQGGLNYWIGQINNGMSRESALINFSESNENVSNVATLIDNGIQYQPWIG